MPMLNINFFNKILYILPLLISMPTICLADKFTEQFQVAPLIENTIANRITEYHSENITLTLKQQKLELLKIEQELNNISDTYNTKAIYWFIKGLNHKNIASFYAATKNKQLTNNHIRQKNIAYEKSIGLANTKNNSLSASIFSTMKHGLPTELKIRATENEIALGGNGENDSYYWYLHWSNIDQLKKSGRNEEAKNAYQKMSKELKNSGQDNSIYENLSRKIETETLGKKTPEIKKDNQHNISPTKLNKTPEPYPKKYTVILSVIILSILIVIAVAIYEFTIKHKKIN